MRVAFASTDGVHIDTHFGWAKQFWLYDVDLNQSRFIETLDSSLEPETEIEKLAYKIASIEKAQIVYCTQMGPKASQMVQAAKIYPVKAPENESIASAIEKLKTLLNDNPPPWLLRILYTQEKEKPCL